MAERSEERTRDRSAVVDRLTDGPETDRDRTAGTESRGRLGRLQATVGWPFSLRGFVLAVVLTTVGAFLAGTVVPVFGSIAALLGIFAVAFGFGALGGRRRYLELGIAGAAAAALGTLVEFLVVALVGDGQLLAVFGAGSGFLAAVLGHYFGRDLRRGMTRDV